MSVLINGWLVTCREALKPVIAMPNDIPAYIKIQFNNNNHTSESQPGTSSKKHLKQERDTQQNM